MTSVLKAANTMEGNERRLNKHGQLVLMDQRCNIVGQI